MKTSYNINGFDIELFYTYYDEDAKKETYVWLFRKGKFALSINLWDAECDENWAMMLKHEADYADKVYSKKTLHYT